MKSSPKPLRSRCWLATVWLFSAALVILLYGSLLQDVAKEKTGYAKHFSINSHTGKTNVVEHKLHFSSAGMSLMNQHGKNENIERSLFSTQQSEKIIRLNIIEEERICALSSRLAWFTQTAYLQTLSPLWHPSIPIAHRKLII